MVPMTAGILFIFIIAYLDTVSARKFDPSDCSVCGVKLSGSTFIVRGGKAIKDTRSIPFLVSLRSKADFNNCAGAILDEYFILTAAHCLKGHEGDLKHDTKVHFQTESPHRLTEGFAIDKMVVHPKYDLIDSKSSHIVFAKYDIGLIKLKKKIKCDAYKRPICLPKPNLKIPIGRRNLIAGWGCEKPEVSGKQSEVLHFGILKHVNYDNCIRNVPETKTVRDHMWCVGGTNQAACYGDSGGPLMDKINSIYTVVGVTSAETRENCPRHSGIMYTNVAKFVHWIREQQKKLLGHSFPRKKTTKRQSYPKRKYGERKHHRKTNLMSGKSPEKTLYAWK